MSQSTSNGDLQQHGLTAQAHPVIGPDGAVFGVELWLGSGTAPDRETVGTFDYDCTTDTSRHGNDLDRNILGSTSLTDDYESRSVANIWQHFDTFPDEASYLSYVKCIQIGTANVGTAFGADIQLTGVDSIVRDVHMSTRARTSRVVGIVHQTHKYGVGVGVGAGARQMLREIASLAPSDTALARVNLETGIVLDWIRPPTGPLELVTMLPVQISPNSKREYRTALDDLARGRLRSIDLTLHVRLDPAYRFTPADITITAVGPNVGSRSTQQRLIEGLLQLHPQLEVGTAW